MGSALSALWKAGSGFPVDPCASEATGHAPAQGVPFTQFAWRHSACATPTFHQGGRCLSLPITPSPEPNVLQSAGV